VQQSPVRLNGVDLAADFSGALWWPAERTLVVADLHLEKGSGYARWGQFLPPYDTEATLDGLEAALARFRPQRVICLGDSFHDGGAVDRIRLDDSRRIAAMTAAHDWLWIAGNHDPRPPTGWGGRVEAAVTMGALVFRHEAARPFAGAGEVSGHYHPKAAVHIRARRVSARCFISDGRRLMLPAFGAYAGGLNVLQPAIARLFAPRFMVHVLGRDRVHALPSNCLRPENEAPTHLLSRMA
jgi:DNA ligase-associated metallophosphoesterase